MQVKLKRLHVRPRWSPLKVLYAAGFLLASALAPFVLYSPADAELLTLRRLQLSDSTTGLSNVTYNFSFTSTTPGPVGSVVFKICQNYMHFPTDPCTSPAGFDASTAILTAQAGVSGFTVNPASTGNVIILSRAAADPVSPQPLGFTFSGITNPANVGSYYVRIATHASLDGSGPETDHGIVVFATNHGIEITTEVPPYLLFCTGVIIEGFNCGTAEGSYVNFGELSSGTTRTGTSQMLASTNAPYGYSITLSGTTMTAGTNVIPAMEGQGSTVGTSQFGINGRQNSAPGIGQEPFGPGVTTPEAEYNTPNSFRFKSGDVIASSNSTDDYRKLTVSYIVNVGKDQPPGRYVATISYICLANF